MKNFIIVALCFLISCGQKADKQKIMPQQDSSSGSLPDTTQNAPAVTQSIDSPDAGTVNNLLRRKFENKWHVLTDKESEWDDDDYTSFINDGRKKNPNYPYIIKGDFNGDGKQDFAATITDNTRPYGRINTKIAIITGEEDMLIWGEKVDESLNHAKLELWPKKDFTGSEMISGKEKKVKMKADGILFIIGDLQSSVIYWDGASFKMIDIE